MAPYLRRRCVLRRYCRFQRRRQTGTGKAASPFKQGALIPISDVSCPELGDVNGDGFPDLVVTSGPYKGAGSVITLLGKGDGTFTQSAPSAIPQIGQFALGDFNGDGKLDYATTTNLLAYGNGDGTFQKPAAYVPYIEPGTAVNGFIGIAAGKLNGDRESDIVLVDNKDALLYVLLSAGKNGFREAVTNVSAQVFSPGVPVIADVNGDGFNDLVLGGLDSRTPIYLNNGGGTFTYSTTVTYGLVDDGSVPIVTDVNGDGIADIIVEGNYSLGVFLGLGSMQFATPFYLGHGTEPGSVIAADLHGQPYKSGKADLVVPDASGKIEVILNLTK